MVISNKPLVSVIMSVYNDEQNLPFAIESILNQTYSNFEFIIVDDGSTDSSSSILQRYSALDSRIVILRQTNMGLAAALNKCISISNGMFIARMDSDDYSFPKRLEIQVKTLIEFPEIGVCGGAAITFGKSVRRPRVMRHSIVSNMLKEKLIFSVCFIHPTVMIRKSVLSSVGYSKEFWAAQDYKLWVDLSDKCDFMNIDEILLAYRINHQGLTLSVNSNCNRSQLIKQVQSSVVLGLTNDVKETLFRVSTNISSVESSLGVRDMNVLIWELLFSFRGNKNFLFSRFRVLSARVFSVVCVLLKHKRYKFFVFLLHPIFWAGFIEKSVDEFIRLNIKRKAKKSIVSLNSLLEDIQKNVSAKNHSAM